MRDLTRRVWAWELLALIFIQSGFFALSNFGKVFFDTG
ncbi:hypothetical protein MIZ03_1884 [Rhodoferax lithotrophicus]|uniref:Uncharacterized protein n=1 Tax=Rhodoferax lithotrophicus TaxID=2798804 RepID=A0ABM7ML04_9BURK|nr:hypothetical protein MIZ03_1884 [Rhodoferax sp. MIZ03]